MSDYKIYNCDCIEFMQDMVNQGKKVDCIITDPPYLYLNHKLDRQFNEELFFELAGKITNKLVFFGRGDSFYKWNLLAKEQGFEFKEEIIWNKKQITSPFHSLSRAHETISVRMKAGVACMLKKRNFIGCEIDKEYFEIAERRLKSTQDTLKQSLFYGMGI